MGESCAEPIWVSGLYQGLLENGIRQVAYVPDAGHALLIEKCAKNQDMNAIPLTTEEEGVALLTGAWLGGDRGVLLMQSSGMGNCINMFSLPRICSVPLLILVTMRGQEGETNPWQVPMGRNMPALLQAMELEYFILGRADQASTVVHKAARIAFERSDIAVVLICQELIGIKSFDVK